jgi:Domain of unknown function (DUF4259)
MGAWGYLPFENDDALNWLDELEGGGAEVVRKALSKANGDYVEAPGAASPSRQQTSPPPARATRLGTCRKTSPTG